MPWKAVQHIRWRSCYCFPEKENLPAVHLDKFENITGKGVKATFQAVDYYIGNQALLNDYQVTAGEPSSGRPNNGRNRPKR